MTKQEAMEKYPNLEYMSKLELVVLQSDARKCKEDKEFVEAIMAILKGK